MKASAKRSRNDWVSLVKPGIIRGNILVAVAGFFLGSPQDVQWWALIYMTNGLGLIIAGACVYNNYLDRHIDAAMERTKNRPLPSGRIRPITALAYGSVLLLGGLIMLAFGTNRLTLAAAAFGFVAYVWIYALGKRYSSQGTLIGSISGSIPPVVGYVAATGTLDTAALALFLILTTWQMPHFYGIALYRQKEYAAAGIPILPIARGARRTVLETFIYIVLYALAACSLTPLGYTGIVYLVGSAAIGSGWVVIAAKHLNSKPASAWGRQMFFISLVVLLLQCVLLVIGPRLP